MAESLVSVSSLPSKFDASSRAFSTTLLHIIFRLSDSLVRCIIALVALSLSLDV
eukprot:CAMPEP_0203659296 /NCGR_PEP_ID=MMETSP0088-20131115/51463_1 /ASSEMBLY_ACC=CAM_ASM_001087 /TAXON_ID=426623 /ORGANISM="Chaetoceros affinis, Strain CCMP159" /LENGTH=53 /DNA_ID=CAMNT_0050521281 /DNA_START=189 /DNA_END=350 /DNA_ORIENTATION=-